MPKIIAKTITEYLKYSESDEEARRSIANAIATARAAGYSGERSLILDEVWE